LIIALVIGSFLGGYYVKGQFDKADQVKKYDALLVTIQQNDAKARASISEYQTKLGNQTNLYNKLTQELKHVKIYTSKCNITAGGIRLWDDSGKGIFNPVPKDTARIIEDTSEPSAITIDDLFGNKVKNDEICNGLRTQINAIIKWDKEVWHDTNSAGNN
jgi:hypothetical protein